MRGSLEYSQHGPSGRQPVRSFATGGTTLNELWGPAGELGHTVAETAGGSGFEQAESCTAYLDDLVIRVPPWLVGEVAPRAARILAPMGGRLN